MRRNKSWLKLYVLLGLFILYDEAAFASFLSLFFASPNQPPVWRPLDPEKYAGGGEAFLDGLAAYNRQDFTEALRRWSPLAEAGQAEARYLLGWLNGRGWGTAKDDAVATYWYEKAVEAGSIDALSSLAARYSKGLGVLKDNAQALQLYEESAAHSDAAGMYGLALLYFHGLGVKKDPKLSETLFLKAAKMGHCKSHLLLSYIYWDGRYKVSPDSKRAYYHALLAEYKGCPFDQLKFFTSWSLDLEERLLVEKSAHEYLQSPTVHFHFFHL